MTAETYPIAASARGRLEAGELCGMCVARIRLRALAGNNKCRLPALSGRERRDSNPGTRRDRPVLPLPGCPGIGGDSRREQGVSHLALRGSQGAGVCGHLLRDQCGDASLSEL
jgi:hypothetical protein